MTLRSKTELTKTASTLKAFSTKIKQAQDGVPGMGMAETLTPEAVQDIAIEISQVADVAAQLAEEIVEGVPAEEGAEPTATPDPEAAETPQIETAQDGEDDEEKKMLKEQVAKMNDKIENMERTAKLEKLATKYANLFTPQQRQAKMKEILEASQSMEIIEAKVQEASNLISGKQVVKVAQSGKSIFDIEESESEEVNFASKI